MYYKPIQISIKNDKSLKNVIIKKFKRNFQKMMQSYCIPFINKV